MDSRVCFWATDANHPFKGFYIDSGKNVKPYKIRVHSKMEMEVQTSPARVEMANGYRIEATLRDHYGNLVNDAVVRGIGNPDCPMLPVGDGVFRGTAPVSGTRWINVKTHRYQKL